MKKICFICLVLFSETGFAQSVKSLAHSDIRDVKVFLNGARITRTVKTTVDAGITQLNIEGLSAQIDKNSISVNGSGDIVLLSVVHELNYLGEEKKSPEIRRLEDSLEELKTDQEKINGLESVYNEENGLLIANKSVGGANSGVDPDNLREVAEFFRSRMIELKMKLIDVHKEQKKLGEKIIKITQQLAELNAKKNQPSSTIHINVSAKQRSSVNLELSYYVTGAGWSPLYDIRAIDIKSPVQLTYKANVVQNTGENWDDLKLILSTGNPAQGGTKPNLTPWYVDFYTPAPRNKTSSRTRGSEQPQEVSMMMQDVVVEGMTKPVSTMDQYIAVDENQLSTDFEIQLPYSIPSDGKQYAVDIQSYKLPASYHYYAAPKLDKDAFLIASVTGWEDLNLLTGKANIYFEGGYIGESVVDPRNTKDTLELSLGRDKKIVILREKKKELSTTRLMGSNVVKLNIFEISVRNTKREAVEITLEDQVPISKNSDIKVNDVDYSGGNFEDDSGKVTWKINVQPGTTEKRKLGFSVKHPKDKIVNGF